MIEILGVRKVNGTVSDFFEEVKKYALHKDLDKERKEMALLLSCSTVDFSYRKKISDSVLRTGLEELGLSIEDIRKAKEKAEKKKMKS